MTRETTGHLLIAAGGTGGHMFPAQALAEEMLKRGWSVTLSTDDRGARYTQGFPSGVRIRRVPSATFARGGALAKLLVPFRVLTGILGAIFQMIADRPDAVVGFGGYPTIPALGAAIVLRVPRMIHEQNGVLGRVNTIFAPRVAKVACGVWPAQLPKGATGVHTGNPVRSAVASRAAAPYIPPGDYPVSVLVIGGSQGARILSDVVPAAVEYLPPAQRTHLRISQQARPEDVDRVTAAYDVNGVKATVETFFHDVPERIAEAQLVIARSGASTVADLTVIGRPSILVPYAAAAGDHQTANASMLVKAGGAVLIPESQFDAETLATHVGAILANPEAAQMMAAGALSAGRPDATHALAWLVEDLSGKQDPSGPENAAATEE